MLETSLGHLWLCAELEAADLHDEDAFVLGFARFAAAPAAGQHAIETSMALAQDVLDLDAVGRESGRPPRKNVLAGLATLTPAYGPQHLREMLRFLGPDGDALPSGGGHLPASAPSVSLAA